MKFVVIFAFGLCSVFVLAAPQQPQSGYTNRYDNIDLEQILKSQKLVKSYVNCLVHNRQCTPEGQELKKILPDALATSCAKCTDKQKQGAWKVISRVQKDYPEDWKTLSTKWDPTGEKFKKFEEAIKKVGNVSQS